MLSSGKERIGRKNSAPLHQITHRFSEKYFCWKEKLPHWIQQKCSMQPTGESALWLAIFRWI